MGTGAHGGVPRAKTREHSSTQGPWPLWEPQPYSTFPPGHKTQSHRAWGTLKGTQRQTQMLT